MFTDLLSTAVDAVHTPLFLLTYSGLLDIFWPPHADVADGAYFDYIIIGSGAGSAVANRLTENENVSVLLIEYGEVPSAESVLPGLFLFLQESYQDWQYRSQVQTTTQSQSKDVYKLAAGKCLGGSSSINHFVFLRGNPHDYDTWAEELGDPSWNYENVLKYFLKSENLEDKEILESDTKDLHSTTGPIVVSRELYDIADEYLAAFAEIGKKTVVDLNGKVTVGYAQPTYSKGDNVRQSMAQAYMRNLSRPNLKVLYNTLATKINFDSNNNAVSVDIVENGESKTVKARKEIILSAGVYGTPKLLMLSGIGPKKDLEAFDIPVIQDLPVGQNLKDHAAVQFVFQMDYSLELPSLPIPTKIGLPIIIGAVNLDESKTYPEYQTTNIITTHDTPFVSLICGQIFGYKGELCDELQTNVTGRNLLYSLLAKLNPYSSGEVKLNSTDCRDNLTINTNYYHDERDLEDMVKYTQDFIKILNSTKFKEDKSKLVNVQFDDCTGDFDDVDYIRCYILHMTTTLYHQTSTCPMGKVVDTELNVIGTNRLRVIDASVFVNIPSANPHATLAMVAEKGADMIKKDMNKREDLS